MAEHEAAKAPESVVEERSALDSLLEKVDWSQAATAGEEQVEANRSKLSQALNVLIHSAMGPGVERVDKALIDSVIADLDRKISAQVNEILHQPDFQKLESAWRGLKFLIEKTDFRRKIKLEILNVSKEEIAADFEDVPEPVQSGLFKHVYVQEYDQAGGEPIGAIIGNYEFENRPPDIALLRSLSKISAACHAPFIGAVGSKFFGKKIEEIPRLPDMAPIFDQAEYASWRGFRDSEDSRYVGLTFPRFLLRLPYGEDTYAAKTFHFEEEAGGEAHQKYLWGNASFAFAATMVRSFAENGWCVNVRGPQSGGLVEDLPLHHFEAGGETNTKIPTEILISDRREFELSELGFIPLSFYKNRDYACFFSANSVQKPQKYIGKGGEDATANSRLSARLPYLFLVSRLAHYLKVIQRENIGAAKEKDDLQRELDDWIQTLVTKMKDPGVEAKAKYPLSDAAIKVTDIADNPGFYNVEMLVRPHFQIEGVDVSLSLVSRLPKGKKK